MNWQLNENEAPSPEKVLDILTRHRLLPDDPEEAAAICNFIGLRSRHYTITDQDEGEVVANVFLSKSGYGVAAMDFIPVSEKFRQDYADALRAAMLPLLRETFNVGVRKVSTKVPVSRCRTKRALSTLGFVVEGRDRLGIKLKGAAAEDCKNLGLLPEDLEE